jgi:chemotaxis protein histidine kinase CheA
MSDFRGPDFRDEPSLDAIRGTDDLIDALATGRPVTPQDSAEAELAALLGGWRDEMRFPPATGLISETDAIAALNAGLAEKPSRFNRESREIRENREKLSATPTRGRRGLSVVGAAAAAVMCIGGFGAVVAGAGPGDALYGLRTMLFGAPAQVRDDQVALAARSEMNQVQELITRGDWAQAQDRLVAVSTQVATIEDGQQKQELLDQFNELSAKVVERNPEATVPPGITYTVPPSATELVPAVAPPTSTPTTPSLTDSATTSESTPPSTTAAATTTAAPTTTAAATTTAAPTTTAAATTTAAPTTTAAATTTSAAQATSTAPTTTTSVSPKSTTSAATTSAATTSAATTSAAPASAATTSPATATTTTPAPAAATAPTTTTPPQTTVTQTTAAPATVDQTTSAEAPNSPAPVTTTAVVIPLPTAAG